MRAPLAALALLALAPAPPAPAQDGGVQKAAPIVVRDERAEAEVYEDTAVEKQTIPAEEFEEIAATNAAEVVDHYPGLRTQQRIQGEQAAVSIEGMPPEYTKILVNGRRYTGFIGEVDDLRDVPLTNVDRIELLRGTQGIRYGTDSGGGVINAVTKDAPERGLSFTADGGGGPDGKWLGAGTARARIGKLGATLSATHDQIDGFDSRDVPQGVFVGIGGEDSLRRTEDLYATLRYPATDSFSLFSNGGWRMEHEKFVREDDGVDLGRTDFDRALVTGGFEWFATESLSFRTELAYYRGFTESTITRDYELDEDEIELDGSGDYFFVTGPFEHLITAGINLRRPELRLDEDEVSFDAVGPDPTISSGGRVREDFLSVGYYVQSDTALTSWANLVLGLRLETHDHFEDELLPQVALLLRPAEWLKLRFQWGLNHRAPSLRDLYQPDVAQNGGAYYLGGNPDLGPESSQSWRAGVEISPRGWINVTAVGFWNEIDDFIRAVNDGVVQVGVNEIPTDGDFDFCEFLPDDPRCVPGVDLGPDVRDVFRPRNLDRVTTRGVEVQLRLRPHELVDFFAGYTFMDSDVESKRFPQLDEIPNEPAHTLDLHLRAEMPPLGTRFDGTSLGVTARYRGESIFEPSGTGFGEFATTLDSEPSWIVDARLTQPIGRHVEIYADVLNLTNESSVDSYEVRGRTFFAGLRLNFGWE